MTIYLEEESIQILLYKINPIKKAPEDVVSIFSQTELKQILETAKSVVTSNEFSVHSNKQDLETKSKKY